MSNFQIAFDDAFYAWSAQDFDREFANEFRSAVGFSSRELAAVKELLRATPEVDRAVVKRAMLSRAHKDAQARSGVSLGIREEDVLENFYMRCSLMSLTNDLAVKRTQRSHCLNAFTQFEEAMVSTSMRQIEQQGPALRGYQRIGRFDIMTSVVSSAKLDFVTYYHSVNDQDKTLNQKNFSLLQWLGIAGMSCWRLSDFTGQLVIVRQAEDVWRRFFEAIHYVNLALESASKTH